MQELIARGEQALAQALESVRSAATPDALAQAKARTLGKKGSISLLFRELGGLGEDERRGFGARLNEWKQQVEEVVEQRSQDLLIEQLDRQAGPPVDVSMPGVRPDLGALHPVSQTWQDIEDIFVSLGYSVEEGPEIETVKNNFHKLNLPPDHPALAMQDTFYLRDDLVLRTHTSPVQVRVMESRPPPVRMIAPGTVYRRDSDLTHTPMFHQVEGLAVEPGLSFADLKGTLNTFIEMLFGPKTRTRFRPSYFPFTEPSAEMDITCAACSGKASGCRVCKETGWLEILGCGMVHPGVFASVENEGYDPETVQGFAFGMGIDRIAMLRYGVGDLRSLFEGDLRFLEQFRGV